MFLNEEFMQIYEELTELNEAKADTQKLIDFAGEDLANRFLAVKNRLKAPENDLYYWIKQGSIEELEAVVTELETTKSKTLLRKEAVSGGDLVYESEHWKVYHITTFEASQYYGRDTKWCITGIDGYGDKYWKDYHDTRGIEFYFLITKDNYDPRGTDSKFAISIYPNNICEVFNQQDKVVPLDKVPYIDEIDYERFNSIVTLLNNYYIAVDSRQLTKKASNKDITYDVALDEILAFIDTLDQKEKDNVKLSWNMYSPDGNSAHLVIIVWSPKELKQSKGTKRVLCYNEELASQIKAALNIVE